MTRFRILETRRAAEPGFAEFDIEWIAGMLTSGDVFRVFDTHHPIDLEVLDCTPRPGGATLRCRIGLAWDGQFSQAVVDTEETRLPAAFRYAVGPQSR